MVHASATADTGPQVIETGTQLIGSQLQIPGAPNTLPFKPGHSSVFSFGPSNVIYTWLQPGPCGQVNSTNQGRDVTFKNCFTDRPSTYTYIATNPEGCSIQEQVDVSELLVTGCGQSNDIFMGLVVASNCGGNDGSAIVTCQNCFNETYSWDDGPASSSDSKSGLSPGPHKVKVNQGGNEYVLNFGIAIDGTRPSIFAGHNQIVGKLCQVGLNAHPDRTGQTYEWFNGSNPFSFSGSRQVLVNNWLGTNYRVKITTQNGCTNEDEVFVGTKLPMCRSPYVGVALVCDDKFNPSSSSQRLSSSITTETLTESTTIDYNMYFNKVLTVPEGVTLTVQNCIVAFSPSAHIVVNGGAIVLETTYIVPCGVAVFPYFGGSGNNNTFLIRNSAFEGGVAAFDISGSGQFEFENNVFMRNTTGIKIEDIEDVSITQNVFYETETAIQCVANNSVNSAVIANNLFQETEIGIEILNGDNSLLAVSCNTLEYTEYGILSEGTLSDFGSSETSAGNYFVSSSTNNNHQFHHTGNAITYYCGPENAFALNSNNGCMATVDASTEELVCPDFNNLRKQTPEKLESVTMMQLFVFPNPTQEKISIACSVPGTCGKTTFVLFDLGSGKKLLEREVANHKSQFEIDLSPYANGVYAGVLRAASGEVQYVKIVKAD